MRTPIDDLSEALMPFAERADAYEAADAKFSGEDWSPQLVLAFQKARSALQQTGEKVKLTASQRNYLEAARRAPLPFTGVKSGSSRRCVDMLSKRGYLIRDYELRQFLITDAGRREIEGKP